MVRFFNKVVDFFTEHGLDLKRVNMLVTDGAPSMVGKMQGLYARLVEVAPQMRSLHCLIHQSVLCAKLSGEFKAYSTACFASSYQRCLLITLICCCTMM